jgi:hypothetical protein
VARSVLRTLLTWLTETRLIRIFFRTFLLRTLPEQEHENGD